MNIYFNIMEVLTILIINFNYYYVPFTFMVLKIY